MTINATHIDRAGQVLSRVGVPWSAEGAEAGVAGDQTTLDFLIPDRAAGVEVGGVGRLIGFIRPEVRPDGIQEVGGLRAVLDRTVLGKSLVPLARKIVVGGFFAIEPAVEGIAAKDGRGVALIVQHGPLPGMGCVAAAIAGGVIVRIAGRGA